MKKNKILNLFLLIALLILTNIICVNSLCICGWLIKISITKYHFIIGTLISFFVVYFIQKKVLKCDFKNYLLCLGVFLLIFLISLVISNRFMDYSYDGAYYHLTSIIRMSEGWNPIYDSITENASYAVYGPDVMDTYATKSIWSYCSSVYSLFGNIDSTKIFSSLIMFATFFLSLFVFLRKASNKLQKVCFSLLSISIAFNPIYISQMFSNYVDSTMGLLGMGYIIIYIGFWYKIFDFDNFIFKYLIIIYIALLANSKMLGLYFAFIFFALYLLPVLYKIIKEKNGKLFKNVFLTGFIGVCLAAFIGINPYITNIFHGNNPFYPIIGSNSLNVIMNNEPEKIRGKNYLEKIIIVNFSKTSNSVAYNSTEWQNPFKIDLSNYQLIHFDTRVGSFGCMFPLIIVISVIIILINMKNILHDIKHDKNIILLLSAIIVFVISLTFDGSWWGRYYSQLWLIFPLISFYGLLSKNMDLKIFGLIMILLLLLNCGLVFKSVYLNEKANSDEMKNTIISLKGKNILYNSNLYLHDYSIETYFKENNIKATKYLLDDVEWDYSLNMMKIKVEE